MKSGKKSNESVGELIKSVANECVTLIKKSHKDINDEVCRIHWIRVDHLLDYPNLETLMAGEDFNFKMYYLDNGKIDTT